jgi:type II secretory pathway pseudopilin PulG
MNMRKAFMLIELLAVIVVIAMMSVAFAALTRPLLVEIPRANRVVSANTSVQNMLFAMRDDADAAVRLPDSFENIKTDEANLLIELPGGVVCYTLEEGKAIRKFVSGKDSGKSPEIWQVPKAKIVWRLWRKDERPYAVEVTTHIEYKQGSRMETKMANSHVFFVGASAEVIRNK